MSLAPADGLRQSARERGDPLKFKEMEPKKKAVKEGLITKHRRIMSTDFHLSSQTGNSSHITPETGSNQTAKTGMGTGGSLKKEELTKPLKIEHRRVQSNVIEHMASMPLSYSTFSKSKEAQDLVKKYTSKLLRYKDLTFKRQKKPTDLTKTEQGEKQTKKVAGSSKGMPKSSASKQSPSKPSAPLFTVPSSSNSPVMQPSPQFTYKKQQTSKAIGSIIMPIKANQSIGLFSAPLEQIFSKTSITSKHKRVQSGEFKGSLKGLKREARGGSAEGNKNWENALKAKKLLMMNPDKPMVMKKGKAQKKESTSNGAKTQKDTRNPIKPQTADPTKRKIGHSIRGSEPSSKKDSGVNIQRIAPVHDEYDNSDRRKKTIDASHLKKVHHKKNASLPVSNPTTKLMENLNLPINMNFKGPTMTPDESRRNSREHTPRAPAPTDREENKRQGSFIFDEEAESNNKDHYFSHLLYSRQKQEEQPKDVYLDFCTSFEDGRNQVNPAGGLNNTMITDKSLIAGGNGTPQGPYQSRADPPNPSKFAMEQSNLNVSPPVGVQGRQPSPGNPDHKLYSQQNSYREAKVDDKSKRSDTARNLMPGLKKTPPNEEFFKDRNDVPLVLQKLILINKIKQFYAEDTRGKDIQTSLDFYQLVRHIGEGSFGKVYQAVSVLTGKEVAIKKFDKVEIKTEMAKQKIFQEARILTMLDHPNVARLLEVFENKGNIFCVMEYAKEGDILNLMKRKGPLPEDLARIILIQVAHGLKHCHLKRVLHRDIKLDNVLLCDNYIAKICDFGISKVVKKAEVVREDCGTPAYTAPEVVSGTGYTGFQADIWSLGIMLFVMVTGKVPFKDQTKSLEILHQLIKKGEFTFPNNVTLSEDLKDLISKMLVVDPEARITIDGIIAHPWFRQSMIAELTEFIRSSEAESNKGYAVKRLLELGFPEASVKKTIDQQVLNHIHCCYQIYKHN
jgi:5'-AMP-activated protein kinase catalytic alpha subunit